MGAWAANSLGALANLVTQVRPPLVPLSAPVATYTRSMVEPEADGHVDRRTLPLFLSERLEDHAGSLT
jgi:hypothetical protein